MRSRFLLIILLALLLLVSPRYALACRLALVLAVDVSKSVDSEDSRLQSGGLAAALRHAEVKRALLTGREPVALAAFEWSGPEHQSLITDWFFVRDAASIEYLANLFEKHKRKQRGLRTAVGEALAFARHLLARVPQCTRQVIDVSGDGYSNVGRMPSEVYETYGFGEIVVNGLVVGGNSRPELQRYFETEVIRGPGAFVISTTDFADYAEAFRLKLIREIISQEVVASADDQ